MSVVSCSCSRVIVIEEIAGDTIVTIMRRWGAVACMYSVFIILEVNGMESLVTKTIYLDVQFSLHSHYFDKLIRS